MPELLCINDKDCKNIKKGCLYKLIDTGEYYKYNGKLYDKSRFKPLHEHIPPSEYYNIIGIGTIHRDDLNTLNNEVRRNYEANDIQAHSIKPQMRELRQSCNNAVLYRKSDNILVWAMRKLFTKRDK